MVLAGDVTGGGLTCGQIDRGWIRSQVDHVGSRSQGNGIHGRLGLCPRRKGDTDINDKPYERKQGTHQNGHVQHGYALFAMPSIRISMLVGFHDNLPQ
jgi:hypothetical protein